MQIHVCAASGESSPDNIPAAHNWCMRFLYFLADSFIAAFGITRPTEKARTQAAFFILSLLILTVIGMAATGLAIHAVIR